MRFLRPRLIMGASAFSLIYALQKRDDDMFNIVAVKIVGIELENA